MPCRGGPLSAEEGGATALDGLYLGGAELGAAEALGQLVAVKVDACGGVDGAQVGAAVAADGVDGHKGVAQRAVLLCVVAVAAEGAVRVAVAAARLAHVAGEGARGGGRVRVWCVVDVGCTRRGLHVSQARGWVSERVSEEGGRMVGW